GTGVTGEAQIQGQLDNGSITEAFLRFLVGTGGDVEAMRLTSTGNVGIGTTAPEAKLDIAYTGNSSGFQYVVNNTVTHTSASANQDYVGYAVTLTHNSSTNARRFDSFRALSPTNTLGLVSDRLTAFHSGINSGDATDAYGLYMVGTAKNYINGNVGIGTAGPISKLGVLGNLAVGATYGEFTAPTSGMIIEGNVGIGTTNPTVPLEVYGAKNNTLLKLSTIFTAAGDYTDLDFISKTPPSSPDTVFGRVRGFASAGGAYAGGLSFWTGPSGAAGTAPTEKMRIEYNGNVGIGTTLPAYKLDVVGAAGLSTGTLWTNTSDARVKQDIVTIPNALDVISALNPAEYMYTPEYLSAHPEIQNVQHYGFIAQEFQQVFPNSVTTSADGYLAVNQTNVIPYTVKAIQEQQLVIASNSEAISNLNAQIAQLQTSYQVDSEGNLVVSGIKASKIILGPEINTPDVVRQLADDSSGVDLAVALNEIATDSTSLRNDVLGINSAVASQSATIADLSLRSSEAGEAISSQKSALDSLKDTIASLSAQIALSSASQTPEVNSSNSQTSGVDALNLTPPELLLATSSAILTPDVSSSTSGVNLTVSEATISSKLRSYGDTFLSNTIIAGNFSVDGTMSLTGDSINSIGVISSPDGGPEGLLGGGNGTLFIQNSSLAQSVNFFNGQVTIDKTGKLTVQEIVAKTITTNKLVIANDNSSLRSGEAGEAISNQIASSSATPRNDSIGSAIIPTGQTEIPIFTSAVTDKSKIFLTPLTSLAGQNLIISDIVAGTGFIVKMESSLNADTKFNWLIIDNK
ncbi:MAG: tail fiber domain-containing protein, partial [Candidatus Daviesbacteria bacterium]|nr:tail fiber domain-containing protein [Candidatus Daviesbacteria bacterium]